jgi:DNA-binding response OmpR family regulator
MMLPSRAAILLVEDDTYIRTMLGEVLADAGYRVLCVDDGLAAIRTVDSELCKVDEASVVLLDMRLPVVDGLGVLHHLAAHGDRVPVVALSASPKWLALAAGAGAAAVLAKPFAFNELLAVVDRVLEKHGAAA